MNLLGRLIDIIYPPRCPICQRFFQDGAATIENGGISFCRSCLLDFHRITSPVCPVCGTPFYSQAQGDHPCEGCLRKPPFYDALGAPYLYEGTLMEAIHQFKYGGKGFLADSLGLLLARFAVEWVRESEDLLTMPVPLHPKRLRERGFNQSLLLARHVARHLGTRLDFLSLRRLRYTSPQIGLRSEERRSNVRGAFGLEDPVVVKGKTVLLVDDVATTGNTLNECARVVKRAGCKKVLCLVLARTREI
jgi:ComF family protein